MKRKLYLLICIFVLPVKWINSHHKVYPSSHEKLKHAFDLVQSDKWRPDLTMSIHGYKFVRKGFPVLDPSSLETPDS